MQDKKALTVFLTMLSGGAADIAGAPPEL